MKRVPTVVRAAELAADAPANHSGTSNVRVIGSETVGATALEVLVGTIVKSHSARPDAYPDLELNPQRRSYATKDGLVCCVLYTNEQWTAFMRAVGEAERFETDPRFADSESRTELHS
jgi:crotonobetainyl-CoA:carnitine CoA-transferase CaiB-like acyl-CoA transferase